MPNAPEYWKSGPGIIKSRAFFVRGMLPADSGAN